MNYIQPTEDIINQIGVDPEITREFCFSHSVCDSNGTHQHWCAMLHSKRYVVNDEIKQKSTREYERMKADRIKCVENSPNTLYFVGMGMEYDARYEDDVCNHRIRTEVINPNGHRFFIEVGTWGAERMRIDHVVDRDVEKLYEEKRNYYYNKIKEDGGFLRHGKGSYIYDQFRLYEEQPYYWYKKKEWDGAYFKYTKSEVLNLVNKLFDCNFNKIEIDYHFLTTEDYVSKSI